MSSGISAYGTAWSNCATAMRYSGVSHSSGAWASASGGLATARGVYRGAPRIRGLRLLRDPRTRKRMPQRDPTDVDVVRRDARRGHGRRAAKRSRSRSRSASTTRTGRAVRPGGGAHPGGARRARDPHRARRLHLGAGASAKPLIDIVLEVPDSADEPAVRPGPGSGGLRPAHPRARLVRAPPLQGAGHERQPAHVLRRVRRGRPHGAVPRLAARERRPTASSTRRRSASSRRDWKYVQQYADAKTAVVHEILARAQEAGDSV